MGTPRAIAAAAVLALAIPSTASAQSLYSPGTYLPFGASLGIVLDGESSLLVGAEVSIAQVVEHRLWYGGFLDLRWDQPNSGAQISIGAEAGWSAIGTDLGVLVRLGETHSVGIRARTCITVGVLALCFGGALMSSGNHFAELSFLFKYPRPVRNREPTPPEPSLHYPS